MTSTKTPTPSPPAKPLADSHQGRPYVYLRRPRCPECGGVRFTSDGTRNNGDGTATRYAKCKACEKRIFIVVE